jgi:Fur family ferric uptake transcriptional regulator
MERKTKQRQIIESVILQEGRPLNPLEILACAKLILPRLGIATVYRTIRLLESEGKLTAVSIPNKGVYYEPTRNVHHHHFHCRVCQKIFEIDCCTEDETQELPGGFLAESHEVIYYGVCKNCHNIKK